MDPRRFLNEILKAPGYRGQLVHIHRIPAHRARYGRLSDPLHPAVQARLRAMGVTRFYVHQAQAINAIRQGHHVIIATSTASGKTLCFNVPVLDAIAQEPQTRALYLYPTKALAQDQLRVLRELTQEDLAWVHSGTYDGDTPRAARTRLRKQAHILLTNPDMLHLGILPNHTLWGSFFRHLRYVVLDEAHHYRGVFGSHVACVLRRLRRICEHYGASPQFIASTATIANPAEHMEQLTGVTPQVIDDDGSPHGPRWIALWNPPFLDRARSARRSANIEAAYLLAELLRAGVRTIVFTRARVVAELILRYVRRVLTPTAPELTHRVKAYRAGYLPEERRRLERELFSGELLGVVATTALELGIDIGGLDAAILVGYPGTIASFWQQIGRAGRSTEPALGVLIGHDNPLDQYFMRHPDDLLGRPLERALTDPDNVYVLQQHLPCAAYEIPLSNVDEERFGPGFVDAMVRLEEQGLLAYRGDRWIYTDRRYPAEQVSLRSIGSGRFAILNAADGYRLLEEIEAHTAPLRVHPGAIYLHQGESYLVIRYDAAMRQAIVQPVDVDYYTQPKEWNDVRIIRSLSHQAMGKAMAFLGQVRVTSQVIGYRRLQHFSEAVLSEEPLEMPPQSFDTVALWWDVPEEIIWALRKQRLDPAGGLHAVEHAAIGILPLFAMCDRWDIGGVSTPRHPDTNQAQVFIYDAFPGGMGIAEEGFRRLRELWRATLELIQGCPCEDGCPSCIQSPKCGSNNQPLDKAAAIMILQSLLW
ncbi:MAG TPA: DEAD/DEAH box helicase [Caldilineae bacterium]|nr:DEAD/DEAH box helicase [Caldilineae bacterium]